MIINSLLDQDFYAISTMQLIFHQYPTVRSKSKLFRGIPDLVNYIDEIRAEVNHLLSLKFTNEDLAYLKSTGKFKADYLTMLTKFTFKGVKVDILNLNGVLDIIIDGLELQTILLEVPILAIINEVYFKDKPDIDGTERLKFKIKTLHELNDPTFKFIEMGTRRRYSLANQRYILTELKREVPVNLLGTSNVMLAKELELTPFGTNGHRFTQMFQALLHPRYSQIGALKSWLLEYPDTLSVALTDTIGIKAFLNDFMVEDARVFQGLRHDSGDPYAFGELVLAYYKSHSINPKTKDFVFSDGLNLTRAIKLHQTFSSKVRSVILGMGTFWSNNVGQDPLGIVIKVVTVNGLPVAKLSDSVGKSVSSSDAYIQFLKEIFNKC